MYAQHQTDGSWQELTGNIVFSSTVFQTAESLSDEQRKKFNVYLIVDAPRPNLDHIQKFGDPVFTIIDEKTVERFYPVLNKTPEELAADNDRMASFVRADRNNRLAESDWTQIVDSPVDKVTWATYRQELRDVPNQSGFPWNVVWPNKPE